MLEILVQDRRRNYFNFSLEINDSALVKTEQGSINL